MKNFKNKFLLTTALIATLAFGGQVHAMEAGDEIAQVRAQFRRVVQGQQVTGVDLEMANQIAGRLFSPEAVRTLAPADLKNYAAQLIVNCVRRGPARTEELQMLQLMVETAFPQALPQSAAIPATRAEAYVRPADPQVRETLRAPREEEDGRSCLRLLTRGGAEGADIIENILTIALRLGDVKRAFYQIEHANAMRVDARRMQELHEVLEEWTTLSDALVASTAEASAAAPRDASAAEEEEVVAASAPLSHAGVLVEAEEVSPVQSQTPVVDHAEEIEAPAPVQGQGQSQTPVVDHAEEIEAPAPVPVAAPLTAEDLQAKIDEIVGRDALAEAAREMREVMEVSLATDASEAERRVHQRRGAAARANFFEAQRAFQTRMERGEIPTQAAIVERLLASGVSQEALDALRAVINFRQS